MTEGKRRSAEASASRDSSKHTGTTRLDVLRDSALESAYVSMGNRRTSSPHEFYRYPARFPPSFAAAAIAAFTRPGDLVLDPFVGGGTTLVEARLAGRPAIGADLNPLATFVTAVKAKPMKSIDLSAVEEWSSGLSRIAKVTGSPRSIREWVDAGYLRNLEGSELVAVRSVLARCLDSLRALESNTAKNFARCAILRTGQAALDMRSEIPAADTIIESVTRVATAMTGAAENYANSVRTADQTYELDGIGRRTRVLRQGVPGLGRRLSETSAPRLVLTSPPYPGVYVNYHRWKVRGRRETPAPYWIANCEDGNGLAYYTMSSRSDRTLGSYFEQLEDAFSDIACVCDDKTVVVQMVGFHDAERDLDRYLKAMDGAGFTELILAGLDTAGDGRLWRSVPNRRWWATNSPEFNTASEVVLVHVLSGERLPVSKARTKRVEALGRRRVG